MLMKNQMNCVLAAGLTGLTLALAGTSASAITLDQSHVTNPVSASGWAISTRNAQTFTAGRSGLLEAVGVEVFQSNEKAEGDLWVEIWGTDATGTPVFDRSDNDALAKVLIPNAAIPTSDEVKDATTFTIADFASENFSVSAGTTYTIRLVRTDLSDSGNPPWILWRGANNRPDVYSGGDSYLHTSGAWDLREDESDHGFQTYVAVPEPTSALLLAGMFVLATRRRRG